MRQSDTISFLQGLRGAQPMIFLAYLVVRRAMTIKELQLYTGLSDDFLRPAVESLAAKGMLYKQTGEHGRVTWVPVTDTFFGSVFIEAEKNDSQMSQSPLSADSGTLRSSSSSSSQPKSFPSFIALKEQEEEEGQSPLLADSALVLKELDDAGIREPKRSLLAAMPHVTPEFIRAHVAGAEKLGTAIFRIENNWPAPIRIETTEEIVVRYSQSDWDIETDNEPHVSHCIWQDDLPGFIQSGPRQGEHLKTDFCWQEVTNDSGKWCDQHLAAAIEKYGSQ